MAAADQSHADALLKELVRKRVARGLSEDGFPKPIPNDGRPPDGSQLGRYPAPLSLSPAAKKQRAGQQKRELHATTPILPHQGRLNMGRSKSPVVSRRDRRS